MAPWSNSSIWVQRSAVHFAQTQLPPEPEAAAHHHHHLLQSFCVIALVPFSWSFCRHGCAGKAKKLPLLGSLPWYLTMNPFHHDLPSLRILIFSRFLLHLHLFRDVPTISFLDTTFRRMFLSFSRKASFFCPNPTRLPRATQALNEAKEPGNQLFQRNRQGR